MNRGGGQDLARRHILVVDDDLSSLELLKSVLTKVGYQVRVAGGGELALQSTRTKLPDLILLDYKMPGMDGIEVCRRLKTEPETKDIPVIFLSALDETDLKVNALEAGAVDYVTKPVERSEVLARVETHLSMYMLQQQLKEEREISQKYLDVAGVMFVALNSSGEITLINKKACNLLKVLETEAVGKNWFDFFLPERIVAEVKGVFNKLMAGNIEPVEYYENPVQTAGGEERIIAFHNSVLTDDAGKIYGILFSGEDITDRKKAEEFLQASEDRFRKLFENAPFAYQSLDENGCFIEVNQSWLNVLGYTRDEIIGKSFSDFLHPDWSSHFKENFPRFKAIGEVLGVEFEMIKKDGSFILVSINGKIGRNTDGTFKQTHCVLHDITLRRRAEKELDRYQKHLEQMVEERTAELKKTQKILIQKERLATIGKLAGSVAHDIRNPLGVINNSMYVLSRVSADETNEMIIKHIQIMEQEINKANKIISDLLDFSRTNEPDLKESDVNNLIILMIDRLSIRSNITITSDLDEDIPVFLFDSSQLERVFYNLIINAIQAMVDGGEIHISTKRENGSAKIVIKDTGPGISAEDTEKIFEPLFTTKAKGVGLGLSIVKTFVEKHRGTIQVESGHGKGTTFLITLPLNR